MRDLFELLCSKDGEYLLFLHRMRAMKFYSAIRHNYFLGNSLIYESGYQHSIKGVKYSAAIYMPKNIAIMKLDNDSDAISFDFSGCYMAVFTLGHQKYAAHIAVGDSGYEAAKQWNDLVESRIIRNIILFKPSEYHPSKINGIWGIITSRGDCYSIMTYEDPNNNNCYLPPDGISKAYPLKNAIIPI